MALKKYTRFCRKYSFRQLPLHQSTLCLYVTYLARSLSFKSIKLYLCAVKQYALAHGFRDRLPKLHFTLRGIKRKLGATGNRKPRMPVTIVLLKQIKSYIMSTSPNLVDQRMLWAASTLAFFGFLRSSEYTSPSKSKYHKSSTLQLQDVTLQESRILVHIKASKTDPFREEITLSVAKTGASVCPVGAIKKYRQVRPKGKGPFFQTASKQYLTRAMMSQLIKDTLKAGNLDYNHFSSHSFHIGAATTTASAGIQDRTHQDTRPMVI